MRISAKVDYAVRAAVERAAAEDETVKGDVIAGAQNIPLFPIRVNRSQAYFPAHDRRW